MENLEQKEIEKFGERNEDNKNELNKSNKQNPGQKQSFSQPLKVEKRVGEDPKAIKKPASSQVKKSAPKDYKIK